jgi:hypothetical protein
MALFYNIAPHVTITKTAIIYHHILTLENLDSAVNYSSIFKTFAPVANTIKLFATVIYGFS